MNKTDAADYIGTILFCLHATKIKCLLCRRTQWLVHNYVNAANYLQCGVSVIDMHKSN